MKKLMSIGLVMVMALTFGIAGVQAQQAAPQAPVHPMGRCMMMAQGTTPQGMMCPMMGMMGHGMMGTHQGHAPAPAQPAPAPKPAN